MTGRTGRSGTGGMRVGRARPAIAVPAALLALSAAIAGAAWLWPAPEGRADAPDGRGGPGSRTRADCAQALWYARGSLPEGARKGRCERTDAPGTTLSGSFRIRREGLDAWLAAAFPQAREHGRTQRPALCPKPGPGYDPEAGDRCLSVEHPDALPGRAKRVEISAEQQVGYDVLIRFVAREG
ncbi:hypothetical protein [Streptomyces vinaceus]|uniref:hypothetical protein n=1 Tax=Streptomyces vinaceus TaxID=1960 RepID=UPI0037F9BDA3